MLDDQAQKPLAAVEVETVDPGAGALGEVADSLAEPIVLRELGSLLDKGFQLRIHSVPTGVHLADPALQVVQLEHAGLEQIDQPSPFCVGLVAPTLQPRQLGSEQLVVGHRRPPRQRRLASHE